MDIWIISFPRSGSNFLKAEFSAMSGIVPSLTHRTDRIDNSKMRISCIRNPKDTLSSWLGMVLTHGHIIADIPKELEKMLTSYKVFYTYLLDSKNIIVDYDIFCKDPESYVKKICNKLNIDMLDSRKTIYTPEDNPQKGYLVSSAKSSKYYDAASEAVTELDLKEVYALYEIALSKSLTL
jgi:hypothetical protein